MTSLAPASGLMLASAGIVLALGLVHLRYTFHGPKLQPRDRALVQAMRDGSLVISRHTSVWRAWIGFNASHGMGAMLFGLIYGYFAIRHADFLFHSPFLLVVGLCMLAGLCGLARRYWFRVPLAGVSLALICYLASVGLALI